ncbi:hypothetical protein HMPREF9098_0563 [Kingella denitrificans ATCC 33394]|uniref:Uncharacterized protein n=1 Tax=Kingella denitrificans ATCC 33394 TaxID=888741 RepID=F0EXH9_9NEIS|nr:hypothetical protein HMPREF9098_0563 [Kingella denitrificans ATCC 33394]
MDWGAGCFLGFSFAEIRFARFQAAFQTAFWAISGSGGLNEIQIQKAACTFHSMRQPAGLRQSALSCGGEFWDLLSSWVQAAIGLNL